jgi:hypothetical protein
MTSGTSITGRGAEGVTMTLSMREVKKSGARRGGDNFIRRRKRSGTGQVGQLAGWAGCWKEDWAGRK